MGELKSAPAPDPAAISAAGANDRIRVAIMGLGYSCPQSGAEHLAGIQHSSKENNTQIIAASDPCSKLQHWAAREANLSASQIHADYRKLLERPDVDAVVICDPDHLHGRMVLDALDAGKHVYRDPPFTRYLEEAFQVRDKVRSSGKTFQLGVVGCSAGAWPRCADLIKAGRIGTLVWIQGYYCRNSATGEWNFPIDSDATPATVNWEQWLGPNRRGLEFSPEFLFRPEKYYRFSAGLLGRIASHRLYPLMLASGAPEFPKRVVCHSTSPVRVDPAEEGVPIRDVPEHVQFIAEFPGGYTIAIVCSSLNAKSPGFMVYGHQATLQVGTSGESIKLVPEKEFPQEDSPNQWTGLQPEDIRLHEKNWFDCIRSGKKPNADIELAIRGQTTLSLAEMSDRLKLACLFDENTRQITDGTGKRIEPLTWGSTP